MTANDLVVRSLNQQATKGVATIGTLRVQCALGRGGILAMKREGDGATPRGTWPVRRLLYRRDRVCRPACGLPMRPMRPDDGWCERVGDPAYNQPVRLPHASVTDRMWRDDHLYDIVLVIGHNDRPRVQGLGSAVFVHLARPGYRPTAGCIAFSLRDLQLILQRLTRTSRIIVM